MSVARYAPAAVLALWAAWSATINGLSPVIGLVLLVAALVVQTAAIRNRYRR